MYLAQIKFTKKKVNMLYLLYEICTYLEVIIIKLRVKNQNYLSTHSSRDNILYMNM